MDHQEQIRAALAKLGPSSPRAIADHLKMEPSALGYHLRKLAASGALKASGTSADRIYALPDQKLDGAAPPPRRTKSRKKPNGKPRKTKKRAARKATAAPVAAGPADFIVASTLDSRLVILDGALPPQIFAPEKTSAIADLILTHFKA